MKKEQDVIISMNNLKTYLYINQRYNKTINGVSMEIKKGKTLCIVGESGCGKSVTATSIMQLSSEPPRTEEGEIIYHNEDGRGDIHIEKLERNGKQMCSLRGHDIAMTFQDSMIVLNPVYTIGWQICEMIRSHERVTKREARARALQLLKDTRIPNPEKRIDQYPHKFSGGMRQRAMIAMAVSYKPRVSTTDKSITALDVTIQAQTFELMKHLKEEYSITIILVTHDMGVVCELASNVAAMYMGNIIESGTAQEALGSPIHPYIKAFLKSVPTLGEDAKQETHPVQGSTPDPCDRPNGCQFAPRCEYAYAACDGKMSEETIVEGAYMVHCSRYREVLIDTR